MLTITTVGLQTGGFSTETQRKDCFELEGVTVKASGLRVEDTYHLLGSPKQHWDVRYKMVQDGAHEKAGCLQ